MSKVTKDVPPFMKVQGNPAKVFGLNSVGLERNGIDKQIAEYLDRLIIFSTIGYNVSQAIEEIRADLEETESLSHLLQFLQKVNVELLRVRIKLFSI